MRTSVWSSYVCSSDLRNLASFLLTILREQALQFRVVANLLRGAFQPGFPNLLDPFTYIRETRKFVRSSVLEPEAPTARAVDQLIAADVAADELGSLRFD